MIVTFYTGRRNPWAFGGWEIYAEPEVAFHQAGAEAVLRLVGLPTESSGHVPCEELPALARRILSARNSRRALASAICPATEEVGGRGCRVVSGGIDTAGLRRRLAALAEVVAAARRAGRDLLWA